MPKKKYIVTLMEEERASLEALVNKGYDPLHPSVCLGVVKTSWFKSRSLLTW